jgi:hypothetical protein
VDTYRTECGFETGCWLERDPNYLGADRVETNGLAIQRKVLKGDATERQSMMTGPEPTTERWVTKSGSKAFWGVCKI